MKTFLLTALTLLFLAQTASAQTVKDADPKDVGSVDSIMKAVYDVISGDAGKERDWDRFRSLFHKDARMIATGKNPNTGAVGVRTMTPEDYIKLNGPFLVKEGFHEREIARHSESYGNIVHAFSTYEAFKTLQDKKPFMRGINSFQLLNDGKRWWVMTIFWEAESPENPIPTKYLKSRN